MAGSEDTVACFLCLKSLDGWEPSDSAWKEHKSHSANCPLVTLNLQASRLRTFDKWSGERVKGGVGELASAGFFHFPKTDHDDTCICFQCGLALDGWEQDDDPHYEHSRRRPNCPHVVRKEYAVPASFDFILSGQSDDLAVKDVNQRLSIIIPSTPTTTERKQSSLTIPPPPSTVKSTKKIRISVSTPSTKKPVVNAISELLSIFPSLKGNEILNLTMEELLERLVKEKVAQYEEFIKKSNE